MGIDKKSDEPRKKPTTPQNIYQIPEDDLLRLIDSLSKIMVSLIRPPKSQFYSGRIYRTEMIQTLGVRGFQEARESGKLNVRKDGNRTSKVYATIKDWELFLKRHYNWEN